MEHFLERLDTILSTDPFQNVNWPGLSAKDTELLQDARVHYAEDRRRIREERNSKSFEEIMEDLLQELSIKPDFSFLYQTQELNSITSGNKSSTIGIPIVESDTSADEDQHLSEDEHWTKQVKDPAKSIGHDSPVKLELNTSSYMVYPPLKSPSPPSKSSRRHPVRYVEQSRRDTYTIVNNDNKSSEDSSGSDQEHESNKINYLLNSEGDYGLNNDCVLNFEQQKNYTRLESYGFVPTQNHLFHGIKDARSTFTLEQSSVTSQQKERRFHFTKEQANEILRLKLGAFVKGHLTRKLFHTENVKTLIKTLHDTRQFAVDFQEECTRTKTQLNQDDIHMIDQLIRQVEGILTEIHDIFIRSTPIRQIYLIVRNEQIVRLKTSRVNQQINRDFAHETTSKQDYKPRSTFVIRSTISNNQPKKTTPVNHDEKAVVLTTNDDGDGQKSPSVPSRDYKRPNNIRRHVTTVPDRFDKSVYTPAPTTLSSRYTGPIRQQSTVQMKKAVRKPRRTNTQSDLFQTASSNQRSTSATTARPLNNPSRPMIRPKLASESPMFKKDHPK